MHVPGTCFFWGGEGGVNVSVEWIRVCVWLAWLAGRAEKELLPLDQGNTGLSQGSVLFLGYPLLLSSCS